MDDVEVNRALVFESALRGHMRSKYSAIMDKIKTSGDLDAETEKELNAAVQDFKSSGSY